ncbi:DUF547 domain-containing protein [Porphyrobacter sp. CACIAM 03H1]|jgi:hypothetical protein|uniref:DUF547 domain-containing protein n=1 Tax=Porphyrobacter sp. CACIAM 03H1 TaxID=2003315 RepID=UPI000B5A8E13|nr:DUF547 domain-containing protein [Porphyrobacter sp. CACIAM 03H1]ASJ90426.1 DUF547 domain-containing protein [Porphyrobacter sp. CACIAM 03H1]
MPHLPRLLALAALLSGTALAGGAPAAAQSPRGEAELATFAPSDTPGNDRIDYSIWDEAMKNIVISMGPSLREGAPRPDPSFGTRRQYGHVSRYRLEGTRVMFSFLDADVIASFTEYRKDLENTANIVDIQSLSRNEQLAYWINLHNVAMVEQIANAWPVRQPRDIKVDGVPLDEARFITVEGIKLSPRDIREKIVYRHWKDPVVIYGFWRGEIGGPSLQKEAFNADNVARLLQRGAGDFVNSLRGSQDQGGRLQVAELYREAAPFFFPDFEKDVRAHLTRYADQTTAALLAKASGADPVIAEYDIADIEGGVREPTYQNITSNGVSTSFRIPQSVAALLRERETKFQEIIRQGRTGTVTFSNITLPGDESEPAEVE